MEKEQLYAYNSEYQKQHIKRLVIKFNDLNKEDVRLYDYLKSKGNIQSYIKSLVKKDSGL